MIPEQFTKDKHFIKVTTKTTASLKYNIIMYISFYKNLLPWHVMYFCIIMLHVVLTCIYFNYCHFLY